MSEQSPHPEVQTTSGRLRGSREGALAVFRGIPFAAPPVGDRRWRAPEEVEAWDGVRDALEFSDAAPQPPPTQAGSVFAGAFTAGERQVSEDCLYLNVWTPGMEDAPSGGRPVMVWIHGGGFRTGTGASPMYDGKRLAQRGDVVIVSINYRLGPIGFLYSEALGGANFGTQDQIAALRWVQREIEAFGGNPEDVTIFGESAGGKSVETLLAAPAARGLFRRAIAQSTYDTDMSLEQATVAADALVAELGLESPDAEQLRAVPLQTIIDAQASLAAVALAAGPTARGGASFVPVVDGDVLPRPMREAIRAGSAADVELLIGTNLDESRLFGAMLPANATMDRDTAIQRSALSVTGGDEAAASATYDAYLEARSKRGERNAPSDVWFAMQTDRMFHHHSTLVAEAQAQHAPTYAYLFTHTSPLFEGALGSCHALEIPFVFGTNRGPLEALTGKGEAVQRLATAMQDAWLAFAKTGDPNHRGLPMWPKFNAESRPTMVLGDQQDVAYGPQEPERRAMAAVFPD